jgi:hypothetical protein
MTLLPERRTGRNFRVAPAGRVLALMATSLVAACGGGQNATEAPRATAQSQPAPTLSIQSDKLPIALKGEAYETRIEVAGGRGSVRFAVSAGALPAGLALDPASGDIRGTPAVRGEFELAITVTDASGSAVRSYTLLVDESAATGRPAPAPASAPAPRKSRLSAGASTAPAATTTADTGDISGLMGVVASMAEGEWRRVNLNNYNSVWTPADLRPLLGLSNPDPSRIILAWSSFAWDPNRAQIVLYGGGHANYRGNDTYVWRASTMQWERAALPSQMVQNSAGHWNAIDGADKAPASAHTYDNTIYLPILDRMLVLGGAADANGGHYLTVNEAGTVRKTGPYLFDPSRAHPDKVGGSTGSHVQRVAPYPDIVGGNMWQNRDSWLHSSAASTPPSEPLSNGCTGYVVEGGRDVVYLRTAHRIYRYEISDLANPAADVWKQVGTFYYGGSGSQATCAVDPERRIIVSNHTKAPFIYWSIATPTNPGRRDVLVTPTDPTGEFATLLSSGAIDLKKCGMDYDPHRKHFKLWCGDGRTWNLTPPAVPAATGWTIVKAAAPTGPVPTESVGTGILGKWKYVPNFDVFMGLADAVLGNVWIYKPHGWVNPGGPTGNVPPSAAITSPAAGASFAFGAPVSISVDASDVDGSVATVEFFADDIKIGEDTAAPYTLQWSGASVGTHVLTARATDNEGSLRTSATVTINVNAPANQAPQVSLLAPADGSSVPFGTPVTLEASASDPDGSIARVDFYANGVLVGSDTSEPYSVTWSNAAVATHSITAAAVDNAGASTTSAARSVTVTPSGGAATVTIQRGTVAGSVVADTYLSAYHKTLAFGATNRLQDQQSLYPALLRFAIFQSEGGPVPNGAVITSAVLSVYKYSSYNMTYNLQRVLQDWSEAGATWNQRLPGVPWATGGAAGIDTDISSAIAATAATDFSAGWVHFDLTANVHEMSQAASPANFGWRVRGVSGYTSALKLFHASEAAADSAALRPKLVVSYQ